MIRIAHILNPVKVPKSSDLYFAQPITFRSMLHAREQVPGDLQIDFFTTQYPEDREIIPPGFRILPDLERSVLDIREFSVPRKLPLIGDILEILNQQHSAEWWIYTNADIGLYPNFYPRVKELIEAGHDAIIINRRRLPGHFSSPDDLPQIYLEKGRPHPGFDCFIFHKDLYPKMRFDHICIGIPFIGVTFAHNLFCFAQNPVLIDTEQLTFHIGMEIFPPKDKEYKRHNRQQFNRIKRELWWPKFDIRKFPYAEKPWPVRYLKWALNPSLFTWMNFKLDLRRALGRKSS